MYITTRSIAGDTFMSSGDCGHATSLNKICKTPAQSAADMLKQMAARKALGPIVAGEHVTRELDAVRAPGGKWVTA
jgi:hypothetical protein